MPFKLTLAVIVIALLLSSLRLISDPANTATPKAVLIPSEKFYFNSFVDCNMAEARIGDTFRIFSGKYGEHNKQKEKLVETLGVIKGVVESINLKLVEHKEDLTSFESLTKLEEIYHPIAAFVTNYKEEYHSTPS